jgi:hypothetical protein
MGFTIMEVELHKRGVGVPRPELERQMKLSEFLHFLKQLTYFKTIIFQNNNFLISQDYRYVFQSRISGDGCSLSILFSFQMAQTLDIDALRQRLEKVKEQRRLENESKKQAETSPTPEFRIHRMP